LAGEFWLATIPGAAAQRRTNRARDIKGGKDMWNGETKFLTDGNIAPLADLAGKPAHVSQCAWSSGDPKKYPGQVFRLDFSSRWQGTAAYSLSSRRANSCHPRPEESMLTEAIQSYGRASDGDPVAQSVRKMSLDGGAS